MRAPAIGYHNISERKFRHAKPKPNLCRSLVHSGDPGATNRRVAQIQSEKVHSGPTRVYGPAKDVRKNLFNIAVATGRLTTR
jgi:hypothetical protein